MNILYIYGWGSNVNSNTIKILGDLLPRHNIFSIEYDQFNPIESVKFFDRFIIDNNINGVVASSFGAFIGININHSVYKFLINPCLMPSFEVPKLNTVSESFISQCQKLENNRKFVDDEDIRFTTAFFSDKDELFTYKDMYLKLGYHKFIDLFDEHHQVSHDGLTTIAKYINIIS